MAALAAVSFGLVSTGRAAGAACLDLNQTVICDDGTAAMTFSNTTYFDNGLTAQRAGQVTYFSDGHSTRATLNPNTTPLGTKTTTFFDDGHTAQEAGKVTYFDDGSAALLEPQKPSSPDQGINLNKRVFQADGFYKTNCKSYNNRLYDCR
jgi:hypothetical protein